MPLAYPTPDRLERILLRTRSVLGEGNEPLNTQNKVQAMQYAASLYDLYDGDGSEATYTDGASITILQSELIAAVAAKELLTSAISYYKDDVVSANGGPASATFRSDKLAWLKEQIEQLEEKIEELEDALGLTDLEDLIDAGVPGLALKKVRACLDPADDVCCDDDLTSSTTTVGVPS